MEAHKLSEVNKYIQQVIALNFEDSLWVKAEISQIKFSGKHVYIDLVEKDEQTEEVIASVSAVIWYRAYHFIRNKFGELADQILADGNQIQCKVKIEFHPKYGLKFNIIDIDPSYTFGQLEMERQKTIEKLQSAGLIGKNKTVPLPRVIQRIAVISSEKAAGLQDFLNQLNQNSYGYAFETHFFQSSVQGVRLVPEMIANLINIQDTSPAFDCIAIIRGGGSRLDLSGFDDFELAKKVAQYTFPVITGIGHDIDQNVIELVAHSPLKTPTAVANFILDHNLRFESEVIDLNQEISRLATGILGSAQQRNDQLYNQIKFTSSQQVQRKRSDTIQLYKKILYHASGKIQSGKHNIDQIYQAIQLLNPFEILKKGYILSYQEGEIIKKAKDIQLNKDVEMVFQDGKVLAHTKKLINKEKKQ